MEPIACSNLLVCSLQTGVSSDGTTLNNLALAGVFARSTTSKPLVTQAKSGALSPGFNCGPTNVSGLPLNVTAFARFGMIRILPKRLHNLTMRSGYGRCIQSQSVHPSPHGRG